MRNRNVEFHFMLTENEAHELRNNAKKAGLSVQSYLRALIENHPIKEQPSIEFHTVLKSLDKIGANINQIAAKANTKGFVDVLEYRKNYDDLKRVIAELLRAVRS